MHNLEIFLAISIKRDQILLNNSKNGKELDTACAARVVNCVTGFVPVTALIKTIVCIYKFINIFTTHVTKQKSLSHNISVSPFSLTSIPVLFTFSRALWVWPYPHSSHSHKLNRTHFRLLELSP